jgi:chromosomal replication initiator protein
MQADLLSSILSAISKRVNQHSFNTWFKPVSRASIKDRTLFLSVPNQMFRDWISSNYFDVIEESLEELDLGDHKISLLIEEAASLAANASSMPDGRLVQSSVPSLTNSPPDSPAVRFARSSDYDQPACVLNPKYTFESFVVGSCNQFAHAAAQAVADMPSKTYNPRPTIPSMYTEESVSARPT